MMNERAQFSAEDARREAAAAWLVRLENVSASETDWRAFEDWLSEPENKRAMDAIDATVAAVEDHRADLKAEFGSSAASATVIPFTPRSPKMIRRAVWASVAAAAAILMVVRLVEPAAQETTYAALAGEARHVELPDGSHVHLNRGAAIRVRLGAHERRVTLDRGEASFAVAHNEKQPFIVRAGEETIRDVGTEFNVLRGENTLVVAVREGVVEVSSSVARPMTLVAGDQLALDRDARRATLSRINADDAFAWQDGRLVYHDAALATVISDINRYGGKPISIADGVAASLRFSGVLVIDAPAAMADRLQAFLPVQSEENASGIVLRSRPSP